MRLMALGLVVVIMVVAGLVVMRSMQSSRDAHEHDKKEGAR